MPKIKREATRKQTQSADVKMGVHTVKVNTTVTYPDADVATVNFAEMCDDVFTAVKKVLTHHEVDPDQKNLDLKNVAGNSGIAGDGEKE